MAAMTSKFNFQSVIQYYTDQWNHHALDKDVVICHKNISTSLANRHSYIIKYIISSVATFSEISSDENT